MCLRQSYHTIFSLLFLATINTGIAQSQVIPDETLTRPTIVEQLGNMDKITGGERVGNNLFHSFEQFSIPEGIEAIFKNDADIENIFTRVTGNEPSFIEGLLKTSGGANLFLMNPNGIVFGENARLDVGGSFIATTADSIEFADGNTFAVRGDNPNVSITVTLPVGVNFNGGNGSITVNGSGSQINRSPDIAQFRPFNRSEDSTALSVKTGKTFALIGGEINLEGGNLSTESGQIWLGSVESGEVKLNSTQSGFSFDYQAISNFEDINLSEKASADASGNNGGLIDVHGANVRLTDGSVFLIQNNGNMPSGSINVKATQSLIISGSAVDQTVSSIASETINDGDAANIQVNVKDLVLQDGGNITSATFGAGKGGEINVNAFNSTELFRTPDGIIERASSRIASLTYSAGDSGTISLLTPSLKASTGGTITSGSVGLGNAGSINIEANFIELNGTTDPDALFTAIISGTFGTGNAGSLNINTSTLKVLNGASVSTDSRNDGAAGNITINASNQFEVSGVDTNTSTPSTVSSSTTIERNETFRQLLGLPAIPNGKAGDINVNTSILNINSEGNVSVRNEGAGEAGELTINADSLNLDKSASITAAAESGIGGNIILNPTNINISNDSKITTTANGNESGGNITIKTTNLNAKKNSRITASSFEGDGGNIRIDANDSISLKDQNEITARSEFGNGGNITLNTDRLQLEKNSEISASAGGEGNGGNVTINTDIFTALNNSRVTANAVRGNGGEIEIDTTGYFVSDDFVVSATSEFGLDGTITINVDEEDLSKNFILPNYPLISLQEVLAKSCLTPIGRINNATRINSLGRGGLPISPTSGIDQAEDVPMQKVQIYSEKDWQPGEPMIQVEKLVTTPDGKRLGVAEVEIPKRCLN